MAGVYLATAEDYQSVRINISPYVDETMLSDAVIADYTYSGRAEDNIVDRLKNPNTLDTAQHRKVKTACILLCAAYLVSRVQQHVQIGTDTDTVRLAEIDWEKREEKLLSESEAELDGLVKTTEASTGSGKLNIFNVADGGRGRWGYSNYSRNDTKSR